MDLRVYLEEDMLTFLDTRLSVDFLKEQTAQPARIEDTAGLFGKNYEKLLFAALQKHDLTEAKKVLHELKDEFSTLPQESQERKQLRARLHVLYNKFKEYLEEENTLKKMERAIETADTLLTEEEQLLENADDLVRTHSEILNNPPHPSEEAVQDKILPSTKLSSDLSTRENVSEYPPYLNADEITVESTDSDIVMVMHSIDGALSRDDVSQAHVFYQQAQSLFVRLSQEEQQQYYTHMIHYHEIISSLIPKESTEEKPDEPIQELRTEVEEHTEVITQRLVATIHSIDGALSRDDVSQAHVFYQQAQSLFVRLSQEEQQQYYTHMIHYHEIISSLIPKESASSISQTEQELLTAMKTGDLHSAMHQYEQLREEAITSSPQERKIQIPRMKYYHKWILSAWNQWQVDHHTKKPSTLETHERKLLGRP